MKKIFTAALFSLAAMSSYAQVSFNVDTIWARDKASEFEIVGYASLTNSGVDDGLFYWERTTNNLASGWTSAVCDVIVCRSEGTDSASFELAKGPTTGAFSFHFYPKSFKGEGSMVVTVRSWADTSVSSTIVINAQAWGLSVKSFDNTPYVCYPNPASNMLMVNGIRGDVVTTITDITGKTIVSETLTSTKTTVNVSDLTAGTYIVGFNDGNKVYRQTFIKQ